MAVKFRCRSTTDGKPVKFDFGGVVLSYVVGISSWSLAYQNAGKPANYPVKSIQVSCHSNQTGSVVDTFVAAKMTDANGHDSRPENSSVVLCCAAVVASGSEHVGLGTEKDVASGRTSLPFDLPGATLSVATGFLSGFNLKYEDTSHAVHGVNAVAGLDRNVSRGKISSWASIADVTGHSSTASTIDGGYIATTQNEGHLRSQIVTVSQYKGGPSLPVDFKTPLSVDAGAGVFIAGFSLAFQDIAADLWEVKAGVDSWAIDGNKVTLNGPGIVMTHKKNYPPDTEAYLKESSISLAVLACKS